MTPCDIRKDRCQQRIVAYVACLRDRPAPELPPVRMLSLSEYEDRLRADLEPSDVALADAVGLSLAQLRLAPLGISLTEVSIEQRLAGVLAFYSSDDKAIFVINRGRPINDDDAVALLAHEATHALQDGEYDLAALFDAYAKDDDSALALRSLIEGDAELYESFMRFTLERRSAWGADWGHYWSSLEAGVVSAMLESESPWSLSPVTFPYAFGGAWVSDAWFSVQADGVEALFATPPASTAELLGYAPQLSPAKLTAPVVSGADMLGELTLGAWHVLIMLQRLGDGVSTSHAASWVGDQMWIYSLGGRPAFIWLLQLADASVAGDVEALLQEELPGPEVLRSGSRLVLSYAAPEDVAEVGAAAASLLPP